MAPSPDHSSGGPRDEPAPHTSRRARERAKLVGAAALAALLLHAALGLELTHRLATRSVEEEQRTNATATCLELALRSRLPRGAVVAISPSTVWWFEQRLTEWATPDWEVAEPGGRADVLVAIVESEVGCSGLDVVVTER